MTKLTGLQNKIVYKKGNENAAADTLSRLNSLFNIQSCSEVKPVWIQEIINSYTIDQGAQDLLVRLIVHSPNEQGYSLTQGIIIKGSPIWVGGKFSIKDQTHCCFS